MKQSLLPSYLYLGIFLWWLLIFGSQVSKAQNSITSDADCPYQPLPSDFNGINYLGFNQEFHFLNTFYYEFKQFTKDIYFNVTVPSAFRFYVAPSVVDVDVWLYDVQSSKALVHTSDSTKGMDETIFYDLPGPGSYKVRLLFFGQNKASQLDCPTLTLEASIIPTQSIVNRIANVQCPNTPTYPNLGALATLQAATFYYDSDINETGTVMNIQDQKPAPNAPGTLFLQSYQIVLPSGLITTDKWGVEITLGTHFLTGGSLGLLIQDQSVAPPVDQTSFACIYSGNCTIGVHERKGHSTIRTVLTPGTYILWIYDIVSEKDFTVQPNCTPFSLFVNLESAHETETFLNCEADMLPLTFNAPGLLDDQGYLYYAEDVFLDLVTGTDTVTFTINETSYFRAYIPETRVDVDLQLTNSQHTIVASFKWGGEEEVTALIPSGVYNFTLFYFGKNADIFCDTFPLEIGIIPQSNYTMVNYCQNITTNQVPNLQDITDQLNANQAYQFASSNQTFQFMFQNAQTQQTITSVSFSINQTYLFTSDLDSNFVLGDVRAILTNIPSDDDDDQDPIVYSGTHSRNTQHIYAVLFPGNYTLSIVTGLTSKPPSLPPCFLFTFSAQMMLQDDTTDAPCWDNVQFPQNLNSPGYLGTSNQVHIAGQFLIPPIKVISASTDHPFTVAVNSFFRAYVQPSDIDVDVHLYENNKLVAWSNQFGGEEALEYMLNAANTYRMNLKFFHWPLTGVPYKNCYTYNFELAISPLDQNPQDTCTNQLPSTNLIANATTDQPFYSIAQYRFVQNSTKFSLSLPFTVNSGASALPAMFRAIITYDFVWNDLEIQLKSSQGKTLSFGELGYNNAEIQAIELAPGDYNLVIYEPFATKSNQFALKNCVDFTLEVALQLLDDTQVNQDTIVCQNDVFPNTLSTVSYLSPFTAQSVYFQETVLADVQTGFDVVAFTLVAPSLIRVYIPVHPSLDIDVNLAFAPSQGGKTIASSRTTTEEIIYHTLNAGSYVLKFNYYAFGGPLPKVEDCTAFPAFISISPYTTLGNNTFITTECADQATLPSSLVGNTKFSQTFSRELDIKPIPQQMAFQITQTGHIQIGLFYNDLVASMAMKLNGTIMINGKSITKTYWPLYQGGQGFLNEILPAGNWTLNVYDPYQGTSPLTNLECAQYTLTYYLNTTTPNNIPICDDAFTLPTDLYSSTGGSDAYGGPQNSKGEIRLTFPHFFIDKTSTINRIPFKVPSRSVMLRFLSEADPGNDIAFNIYQNSSSTTPILSAWGQGNVESAVWPLQPQGATPYILEIKYLTINKKVNCNYFHLDFAIETSDNVRNALLCPAVLPNEVQQVPPETVVLPYGQDYTFGSDNYLFTASRINNNLQQGVFRYRMTLEVPAPTILYSTIGFDFVTNDFNLVLSRKNSDGTTSQVALGKDSIPSNIDSDVNYQNIIQYNVSLPGVYYLDITEDMTENSFNISNACHYFSFTTTAQSQVSGAAPRVVSVNPASGYELDPYQPLNLKVLFSDQLSFNSTTQTLLQYIIAQNSIYMKSPQAIGLQIPPTQASIKKSDKTTIQLTFSGQFNVSMDYILVVDAGDFQTSSGILFQDENSTYPHIYRMYDCDCSGNGQCVSSSGTTSPMKCICDDPWTGSDCSKCQVGYHGAGTKCVQNTNCTANSCNGNGKCNDDDGYPECQCNQGYASATQTNMCGQCDYGYVGYPNCQIQSDDEGTLCIAPILPTNLNSIEFLGTSGRVHLQDDYYLDLVSGSHNMMFSLNTTSVLRVYTEPHHVDVDLWLYTANPDGSINDLVDKSLTFGHEEILLDLLQPGQYILMFKYYLWDKTYTVDCETFNMELAVDTVDQIDYDAATWLKKCGMQDSAPQFAPANPDGTPAVFNESTSYFLPGASPFSATVANTNQNAYIWNTSFTIATTMDGQVAMLDAVLGYQFLIGDVSLVLQSGFGSPKCKGSDITAISGCIYGDNEMNRNALHATLQPGNYTLFIYAPEFLQVNLSCILYTFEANLTFIFDQEDYFNCDADILPKTLNNPEFINNGYLHIQDQYLIDSSHYTISFSLTTISLIRVVAEQDFGNVTVTFINTLTNATLNGNGIIYTKIAPGKFLLALSSNYISSSKNFCPMMNLEIAIEPITNLPVFPAGISCPSNGKDVLPNLSGSHVPFSFENGTVPKPVYYHFPDNNPLVAQYSFTLTQVVYFYSAIASEFLRNDLRVNLYKQQNGSYPSVPFISGTHDYNYNYIESNLDPANYQLKIERASAFITGNQLPCMPFELEFTLLGLSKVPQCSGEPIPTSLNGIRFLGTEGTMHYESDNFVVPQGSFTHANIPLQAVNQSVLRVYVSPHVVDIDIKLIDPINNSTVISGSNGIGTEEAFITLLQGGKNYTLQVQFWKWSKNIPTCSNFNMEIAIGPVQVSQTPLCPNGADFWPPDLPKTLSNNMYTYNSLDLGAILYFQQMNAGSGLKSHTMPFTITTTSSVHAQVGYDFLSGELAVKIQSADKKKTYYGQNRPNRNMLDIQSLPAGQYNLFIYEPYSTLDQIMGCSFFNFELYIQPFSAMDQEEDFYHYLPRTLDTYAYLQYNGMTHLQGEYWMFTGNPVHNTLNFTLFEPTFIRVHADVLPADETEVYQTVYSPLLTLNPKTGTAGSMNSFGSIMGILTNPNTYNFGVQSGLTTFTNTAVDIELIIEDSKQVEKEIAALNAVYPANCSTTQTSITISPDGYFFYNNIETISNGDMATDRIIQTIPFTIEIPTLVFIQLGYQFLFLDVDVKISSKNFEIQGKHNRNLNEINAILQPGSYNLVITSIGGFPQSYTAHCTPYRLAMIFRDASDDDHVDCSLFTLIPWDLNMLNATSTVGGPIDGSGTLNLYSNDFLVPTSLASNISLAVSEPTLINIFTTEYISTNLDYDIYQSIGNTEQATSYSSSLHQGNEKTYLFILDGPFIPKSPHNPIPPPLSYYIDMTFTQMAKGACPAFTMQILMKPLSYLNKELACPSVVNSQLPSHWVVPDAYNSYTEFVSSIISGDYIQKNSDSKNGFVYNIDFTTKVSSRIDATFSYYSLASNFILTISSRNVASNGQVTRSVIGTGDWSTALNSGITTLSQTLTSSRLKAGNYTLTITHPPLTTNYFTASVYSDLCFPFIYTLNIMDSKTVYAGQVSPAAGSYMPPNMDLLIQIQFSEPLYDSANNSVACLNTATVMNSFSLINKFNNAFVAPSSVVCASEDATTWNINFAQSTLSPATTYQLLMTGLFDDSGAPAVLPQSHLYSMIDTSCSSNGQYVGYGCQCAVGYQGQVCDQCQQGFINNNPNGAAECVTNLCQVDTCNCKPDTPGCVPLGTCHTNPISQTTECLCGQQYNGTTCNRCANGYTNYPYCTPNFSCQGGCGKGSCDKTSGTCQCPDNFQGPNCGQCASGYSGKDCKKIGSSAIIALEVIAALLAAGAVVGFGAWYIRQRFRAGVARYKMLPTFEIDESEYKNSSKFPGLYDDSDEENHVDEASHKYSINSGGQNGKTKAHVFSFANQPSNSLMDTDSDEESNNNNSNSFSAATQNNNKKSFFDM
ncbi:hypothetical protein DLAC_05961 [Tieghemostelium lacteum]|uniref:EGF-like domain-containing protein n=1 Tax=Tieghemostelium lacteum TaxID=361077 RepID=A0A151ZH52_TIELA|nr:hypothetical protein DLAC_05961 [Tieghemostelium lacteum]|eukprot:KYQ93296.1 hypothetical protein DLAC_05961 [Tieghemostelium lacteum]